jgi:tetratricopeptide (TPR) repeat protein
VIRAAAAIAVLGACVAAVPAASAQSRRYPPPIEDLDAEAETHSDFWEEAIEPGRREYDDLVDRASRLLARRGEDRAGAIELLHQATRLLPRRADAWAWLGLAEEAAGDHAACRDSLGRAWAIEPTWARAPRPLGVALGVCRSRAGDLDGALDALERVIARGGESVEALWRLGEVYLALERVDDARAVLEIAVDLSPADVHYAHAAWALVVAADRARDPVAAAAAAAIALRHDPYKAKVEAPPAGYLPASEVDYYVALAHDLGGDAHHAPERALFRFRRYLAAVTAGPWLARAREHVKGLGAFHTRDRVAITGTEKIDDARVRAAVGKLDADLRACVKPTPRLVAQVSVTLHGPKEAPPAAPKRGGRRAPKTKRKDAAKAPPPTPPTAVKPRPTGGRTPHVVPPVGVKVVLIDNDETADADVAVAGQAHAAVEAAVACLERVAAKAAIPAPTTVGTWAQITFPVIWR